MQLIDWIFVAVPLLIVWGIAMYTQRYMRSVADFLTAGRGTGRYLLAVSRGELQGGAAIFVSGFEVYSHAGFITTWWAWITLPVSVVVAISGFVFYRYRETRAMTLGQFFELRYSKSFRLFAGFIGFFAGILNFAVIPVVGARIMCYFMGFPPSITLFSLTLPTEIIVLAVLLSITTTLTLAGGLITVIITNGAEGIISLVLSLAIIFVLMRMFSWNEINTVLVNHPHGQSFLNPFDSNKTKDFNMWYVLMNLLIGLYGTMAWQNQSAYNSAGTTPHESRMAGIVNRWLMFKPAMTVLLVVCAMTYLHHPHFAAQAAEVQRTLAQIPDPQTQEQVVVPVTLSHLLPAGIKGALCVIFMMGIFGGDGAAMLSWGGLFIQDILVPLRKKPFSLEQHIFYLRLSIIGVALFAFVFGSFFQQTEYLQMWWGITMAVFVGGAGAAILGGLYWNKGTAAGAWVAMVTGSILSVAGIAAKPLHGHHWGSWTEQLYLDQIGPLPQGLAYMGSMARQSYLDLISFNGIQISFAVTLIAATVYVAVSLLTHKEDFNMDRMLHRGAYAKIKPLVGEETVKPARGSKAFLSRLIGVDDDFTLSDKWIAASVFIWSMLWFLVFVIGSIWNLIAPWSIAVWSEFWHISVIYIPVSLMVLSSIWFTCGASLDMRNFFRHLREQKINPLDDGTVVNHQNLDESQVDHEARKTKKTIVSAKP
jgi:SSS family solute:Na+ symporter